MNPLVWLLMSVGILVIFSLGKIFAVGLLIICLIIAIVKYWKYVVSFISFVKGE